MTLRWRAMRDDDADAVGGVAEAVHPAHPEDRAVLAERFRLFPAGCLVLAGASGVAGYALAHPWRFGQPPGLKMLLRALPADADTFYLHDLAMLPAVRGGGWGGAAVEQLAAVGREAGLSTLSLVAVNGSGGFWARQGLRPVDRPEAAAALGSYRGATLMVRDLS